MKVSVLTLFPEIFEPVLSSSIVGAAQKKGLIEFELINLRDFGEGLHKIVDDKPYGGGAGMVLKANILTKAVKSIKKSANQLTILMSPAGTKLTQPKVKQLARFDQLVVVCGHYEGVDQRFIDSYIDEEISIGDYILTGGELAAMVVIDATTRLIPGVFKKAEVTQNESFEDNMLEHPHYTRPQKFEDKDVPATLLSGNHHEIDNWRKQKSLEKTKKVRPDLLKGV